MKCIVIGDYPTKTAECAALLRLHISGAADWKRTLKVTYGDITIRTFRDGENPIYATIVTERHENTRIFPYLDFTPVRKLVKNIIRVSKKYYTHDYGDIYINPYTLNVYAVGGDCGYFYSNKSKAEISDAFDTGDFDFDSFEKEWIEINEHPSLTAIKKVEWEAECSPEEPEYIKICEINLID